MSGLSCRLEVQIYIPFSVLLFFSFPFCLRKPTTTRQQKRSMRYSGLTLGALGALALKIAGVEADNSTSSTPTPRTYSELDPSLSEIQAAASSAVTAHRTSDVKGAAVNRFYVIFLENTDYDKAAEDESLAWLAKQGISLTNYWSLTHPSEPNYLASVAGDYFALDDDRFISMPSNVSNIVDLLDTKNISWAEYQEHIPYTGFQGFNYSNQETFANDYVRKHNPLILFDNVVSDKSRLANIKSFEDFNTDLKNKTLPQYAFITPNMTNDGHDSNIKVAGDWSKSFLQPLLSDDYFMKDTLVLLTFDENETYGIKNKVFSILLGGVIPDHLKGTSDDTFYDHYSQLATVEANWNLPHLGRHDVDANVLQIVANATNITNVEVDTRYMLNNETYIGYLNDDTIPLPAPNVTALNRNGKPILDSIKKVWADEYSSQVSASYFTATTTTVSGSFTDAATLVTSGADDSEKQTSGADSSATPTGAASSNSSKNSSGNSTSKTKTSKGAASTINSISMGTLLALLCAMVI